MRLFGIGSSDPPPLPSNKILESTADHIAKQIESSFFWSPKEDKFVQLGRWDRFVIWITSCFGSTETKASRCAQYTLAALQSALSNSDSREKTLISAWMNLDTNSTEQTAPWLHLNTLLFHPTTDPARIIDTDLATQLLNNFHPSDLGSDTESTIPGSPTTSPLPQDGEVAEDEPPPDEPELPATASFCALPSVNPAFPRKLEHLILSGRPLEDRTPTHPYHAWAIIPYTPPQELFHQHIERHPPTTRYLVRNDFLFQTTACALATMRVNPTLFSSITNPWAIVPYRPPKDALRGRETTLPAPPLPATRETEGAGASAAHAEAEPPPDEPELTDNEETEGAGAASGAHAEAEPLPRIEPTVVDVHIMEERLGPRLADDTKENLIDLFTDVLGKDIAFFSSIIRMGWFGTHNMRRIAKAKRIPPLRSFVEVLSSDAIKGAYQAGYEQKGVVYYSFLEGACRKFFDCLPTTPGQFQLFLDELGISDKPNLIDQLIRTFKLIQQFDDLSCSDDVRTEYKLPLWAGIFIVLITTD